MLKGIKKMFKVRVGFVLRYTRVLAPSGEQFEVTTNLPSNAQETDFIKAFALMGAYPEARMNFINEMVQKSDEQEQKDTPLNRQQRRELKNKVN